MPTLMTLNTVPDEQASSSHHLSEERMKDVVRDGLLLSSDEAHHLEQCTSCRSSWTILSLGLQWVETTNPVHAKHATELTESRLMQWVEGSLSRLESHQVKATVAECPVCRRRAQITARDLVEARVPVDYVAIGLRPLGKWWHWPVAQYWARTSMASILERARTWTSTHRIVRPALGFALAAAAVLVILRIPQPLPEVSEWDPDMLLRPKSGNGARELQVSADIVVPDAQGSYRVETTLESDGVQVGNCPANAQVRFRVRANGSGYLSLWSVTPKAVKWLRTFPQSTYGGNEAVPLLGTDGERYYLPLDTYSGSVSLVTVLSRESPPEALPDKWLQKSLAEQSSEVASAPIRCTVVPIK